MECSLRRPAAEVVQRLFKLVKLIRPGGSELPDHSRIAAPTRPLHFGPGGRFELRPAEYRLLVDGQPAALGGRALDLLMALAARPAELLTKNELLDLVWPGLVVEEGNLRVQINTLRRLLGEDAIATVPGRGYRLTATLWQEPPPTPPAPAAGVRPPRLFGRDADLARLEARLQAGGCVTLVGSPGVGKSSLARLALARWAGRGAWVDLAPLTQPGQVAGAVARALGLAHDDEERLPLPDAPLLLVVLDNAEHLVDGCVAWMARAAPPPRLLVTSQLPLRVAGEQVLHLEPLPVAERPAPDDALALLLDRITAADHRFQPTPAALPLLTSLCHHLDGLPLALEMAAARIPLMGAQAVHDALAERFALLARGRRDAPARHRSLHDALDWSYGLLGATEQRLFRALGVFAGGFTLDLALTLTADEHVSRWDIVDGLATLVERSLLTVSGEDPPRYRLLETMRAYALQQLGRSAEGPSLRRRHASAVLGLFMQAGSDADCLAEMHNARDAFAWAREHELAVAAQLSARVAHAIGWTIWRQEVTDWMLSLQPAMLEPAGQALPLPIQAYWWSRLAYVLNVRRDRAATAAAKQAVALWRQLEHPAELQAALAHWVRSLAEPGPELDEACAALQQSATTGADAPNDRLRVNGALAEAARVRGDLPALLACREQELAMARVLGWDDMAQAAESNVCAALIALGRYAEAAEHACALLQRIDADAGDTNGNLPWALGMRIEALVALGRLAEARALLPRSLAASRRFGTTVAWQGILGWLAAQQRFDAAGRLLGHVERLWSTGGASPDRDERARLAQVGAAVQARLGADVAAALAASGRQLDAEAAAALALRDAD